MRRGIVRAVLSAALLAWLPRAHAALLAPTAEVVHSAILGQDRPIEVYLPEESAKDPAQRFDTLYVLDGDWNTKLVTQVVDFLHQLGMVPPLIVVSIPNVVDAAGHNSRDHDLTPTVLADEPLSGGSHDFLKFLATELVPHVDQRHPANGVHLVHGHSYGGLFLMYALANDTSVFDGYVVLDPAMWWDNGAVTASVQAALARLPGAGKALYIAGRDGAGFKEMGIDGLDAAFRSAAAPGLHWSLQAYEDESHDSLKWKASYDGLKYLYGGYTPDLIQVLPEAGTIVRGRPVRLAFPGRRVGLHYTTDGSEPTEASPSTVGGAITIDDVQKTRIKLLSTRGVIDREIPLGLVNGPALPPQAGGGRHKADEAWRYAVLSPQAWSKLGAARPLAQGVATAELPFKDIAKGPVAVRIERVVSIAEPGYYVFFFKGGTARLRVNGRILASTDAAHAARGLSYLAPLQQGTYLLSFEFLTNAEDAGLQLAVLAARDGASDWWRQEPWLALRSR